MKDNIFTKIMNFFKRIFNNQDKLLQSGKSEETTLNKTQTESEKLDKKEFFEIYEKLKKGDVDILSMDPDKSEKMCKLLEEEIKLKEKLLDSKLSKANEIDEKIKKLDEAV